MISTIQSTSVIPKSFPKLMEYKDDEAHFVVLFYATGRGVVVYSCGLSHYIGYHYDKWSMNKFSDYNGNVNIQS